MTLDGVLNMENPLLNEATVEQLSDELLERFPEGLIIMGINSDPSYDSEAFYIAGGSIFARQGMVPFITAMTSAEFGTLGYGDEDDEDGEGEII